MRITHTQIYQEIRDIKLRIRKLEKVAWTVLGMIAIKAGGDAVSFVSALW